MMLHTQENSGCDHLQLIVVFKVTLVHQDGNKMVIRQSLLSVCD